MAVKSLPQAPLTRDSGAPIQWNNWAPEKVKKIESECGRGKHDWRGNFITSANGRGYAAVQGKGTCANCGADLQQTLLAARQ